MEADRHPELSVTCPYCGSGAALVDASVLFPHNAERARSGWQYWHCAPCRAWTRARVRDNEPVGRLADPMLRGLHETVGLMLTAMAERSARKNGGSIAEARASGRLWLGKQVGIAGLVGTPLQGMWLSQWADVEECRAAIRAMERYVRRPV